MIKKLLLATFILINVSVNAQETRVVANRLEYNSKTKAFKISKNKGTLSLNLGRATIEGYEGDEIIFEGKGFSQKVDERSKGLQSISQNGLIDNTDLGINVTENNDVIEVKDLNEMAGKNITIKVPKKMKVVVKNESEFAEQITIKNMVNELEVDLRYSSLNLENITGPATAKVLYGNIEAKFNETVKGPISLVSIYGFVDLAIPSKTNADFKISTNFGDILTEPSLNLNLKANDGNQLLKKMMLGKMNAGGNDIQLKSDYNKIYIRSFK